MNELLALFQRLPASRITNSRTSKHTAGREQHRLNQRQRRRAKSKATKQTRQAQRKRMR